MVTYAALNQLNPSINVQRRKELRALYEGGEKLERSVSALIPQRPQEKSDRYQFRLKEIEYRNYLGPIIDYFASMLFVSQTVSKAASGKEKEPVEDPGEYWSKFREDCDRGGTDLDALFKRTLTDAMVSQVGWLRVHHPTGELPDNLLDADTLGFRDCWLEHIENDAVLDWDTGDDGRLLWAVTHKLERPRGGLAGDRRRITETWDHLTRDAVETFSITYDEKEPPKPETEIPRIAGPEPHRFKRVPLVCVDLPDSLWVANRLRSPQLAHFRKVCAQNWSLSATAFAMPVVKVEDQDEYRKQTAGAGYEILIGSEDSYEWQAPPAEHFTALDNEIRAAKDEIFRIAHQMALGVENNAAAVGRSAESKASDLESTRVVLVAFSRIVRETIEYTLDLISTARGEEFTWSVEGLDDFAALDAAAFAENLKALKDAGVIIPSRTFKVALHQRVAELTLPHLDENTKATVREEIESGTKDPVEEQEEQLQLERDIALKAFDRTGGAAGPGSNPAKGKPVKADNQRRPKSGEKLDRPAAK